MNENMDNYNYPMGSDTPDAPWNEVEYPEIEVDVTVNVGLTWKTTVMTDQYADERGDFGEIESRELLCGYHDVEDMVNEQHYGVLDLLEELTKYINGELAGGVTGSRKWQLEDMLDDCKGWTLCCQEVDDYKI